MNPSTLDIDLVATNSQRTLSLKNPTIEGPKKFDSFLSQQVAKKSIMEKNGMRELNLGDISQENSGGTMKPPRKA